MRQAITTKFLGPTNFRGSRIVAIAQGGRVIINWDDALNPDDNHKRAAQALADKLEWHGKWIGGASYDGKGYVFVIVSSLTADFVSSAGGK